MHLPQPTFRTVGSISAGALDKFHALVIPAYISDAGSELLSNEITTQILAKSGNTYAEILQQWPNFSAKAGEILEIPLTPSGTLVRLFILGFGSDSIEDARKAGAALGRKVKSTGYSIFSTYSGEYDAALAHMVALSLSQYGWN
ncbi:MAG: hypothetical protein WCO95_03485, partial [Actinomycetes bacterium]